MTDETSNLLNDVKSEKLGHVILKLEGENLVVESK